MKMRRSIISSFILKTAVVNPVMIGLDVTNLQGEISSPALEKANLYTFEMVKTSAIRVDMTAQAGKGLGITEIKSILQVASCSQ